MHACILYVLPRTYLLTYLYYYFTDVAHFGAQDVVKQRKCSKKLRI